MQQKQPEVLVAYASTHGQTEKIARRMASTIGACGFSTRIADVDEDPDPEGFVAVLAGASLHGGKHQPEMAEWLERNVAALSGRTGAFFSVSLTAAEETREARTPATEIMNAFLEHVGWRPTLTATVAGALQYREYDRFTRVLIRLMMKRGGKPTDTSHDHEYTDWDAVDEFARSLAAVTVADQPTAGSVVNP